MSLFTLDVKNVAPWDASVGLHGVTTQTALIFRLSDVTSSNFACVFGLNLKLCFEFGSV
jgi:hypothetical protein